MSPIFVDRYNQEGSFHLVIDLGRPIGTKGQTNIRVIIENDGKNMKHIPCKSSVVIDYIDLSIGHIIFGSQLFSEVEGHLIILIKG